MKKRAKLKALGAIALAVALVAAAKGHASYSLNVPCGWCGEPPTKKYETAKGTRRYYCRKCSTTCIVCSRKAKKSYTEEIVDMLVFLCAEHYQEAASEGVAGE
jgi:hypothetical protein